MTSVKIRGIYAESLTQILLQNHFEIVQPTADIASRFGLPYSEDIPDVDIWDRSDLQGIVVISQQSTLKRIIDVLRRRLGNIIARTPRVAKSSIYKGYVQGRDEKTGQIQVNLGDVSGILFESSFKEGSEILVQVQAHDYGLKAPVLSSKVTIPGRVAILIPEPVVRLSLKIKDPHTRNKLLQLGRHLLSKTGCWGILWRTSAENLSEQELRDEVEDLLDIAQEVRTKFEQMPQAGLILEGTSNADIEFPAEVKIFLDRLRAKIKPTIDRHHFYKSAGYSSLVELAELVIEERPCDSDYLVSKIDKVISRRMPRVHDELEIEHVKLDGRAIILSHGRVVEASSGGLLVKRLFRHANRKLRICDDFEDVLPSHNHDGDYALTRVIPGANILCTEYYTNNDELKGTYVNINTGVEVYPGNIQNPARVRYVDLEVDVIWLPDRGIAKIVDQHLLNRAVERGYITEEASYKAIKTAESILSEISTGRFPYVCR